MTYLKFILSKKYLLSIKFLFIVGIIVYYLVSEKCLCLFCVRGFCGLNTSCGGAVVFFSEDCQKHVYDIWMELRAPIID